MKSKIISVLLILSAMVGGCSSNQAATTATITDKTTSEGTSFAQSVSESKSETQSETESIATDIATSEETTTYSDTIYYSWDTYRLKYYDSIDELFEISELIITGDCISSKPVYQLGQIYTVSEIKVNSCYKGAAGSGDIIQVVEIGGRDTYGEWRKNCNSEVKDFPTETHPDDSNVVIGIDGFYPIKEGDSVLLFLGDTTGFLQDIDGTLYGVMSDTDGKLYLQDDGTFLRATPSLTDELVFDENNLSANEEMLKKLMHNAK